MAPAAIGMGYKSLHIESPLDLGRCCVRVDPENLPRYSKTAKTCWRPANGAALELTIERISQETGSRPPAPPQHVIVIPDDFPPVFTDSTALMRLRRRPDLDLRLYTTRPADEAELLSRISPANSLVS